MMFPFYLSILKSSLTDFGTQTPYLWVRLKYRDLTLKIILLHWRWKVGHHHENYGFLRRPLHFAYLVDYIGCNSLSSESLSHVLVPSIQSTKKYHPFVLFFFPGAFFGQSRNPSSLLIPLSSDQWSSISLNIINSLNTSSHEVRMD